MCRAAGRETALSLPSVLPCAYPVVVLPYELSAGLSEQRPGFYTGSLLERILSGFPGSARFQRAFGGVRVPGDAARGGRTVRSARLHGGAAHTGDRAAHG